ncbi:MAG TPA: tetratricopeptide repeat protein [Terriglobales bacterium]|nr:tetratricopeptide repeat protein [Terriglobales bacterium]
MSYRKAVLAIALTASFAFKAPLFAQDPGRLDNRIVVAPNMESSDSRFTSGISGSVRTQDDRPLGNARIEVHEIGTGATVASGYTSPSGVFEITGVRSGSYEVIATSGLSEARDRVRVDGADVTVTLRMPHVTGPDNTQATISVADMRVPDKARKQYKKAREALAKDKLDETRKYVAKALEIYPQYSDALTLRAITQLASKNLASAAEDLHAAIQYDPSNADAYVAMGALYNTTKRFEDALRVLDRGVALDPTSWHAYFEMARAQLGKSDFEAALRQSTKAEELLGQVYGPVYLVKGHALLGMKNYPAAVEAFEKFLAAEKDDSEAVGEVRQQVDEIKSFMASAK